MMLMNKIIRLIMIFFVVFIIAGCNLDNNTYYKVTFLDDEGTVLATDSVLEGNDATAPSVSDKEGYKFVGWDKEFTNVTEDLEVTAIFKRAFKVTFLGVDDEVIKTELVVEGSSPTEPDVPEVPGYIFIRWDKSFRNVTSDMEIRAEYIRVYTVVFYDQDGNVIKTQEVFEGNNATAPSKPIKEGYRFVGWDKDFTNVQSDLEVHPIFEWIDPLARVKYSSYVTLFEYFERAPLSDLLKQLDYETSLEKVIPVVYHGKFRNTNQLHYYDASNYMDRNIYGFEVAVDASGIVVDSGTLVELPSGGFILSGHGTQATYLKEEIKIGDVIVYNYVSGAASNTANVYRNYEISNVIGLGVEISKAIAKVENAFYNEMYAVDYETIIEKLNLAISNYNNLVDAYDYNTFADARGYLLNVDFLLVEGVPVQVKSFWHYPLRSGSYAEASLQEVQILLDQIQETGFNRVYLNTNFGGYSIYKSEYLIQKLSTNRTYGDYKDYLECFVTEAHRRGIEVYAWTNTLICGDGAVHSSYRDRGWIQIGYHGEDNFNGMYFLDISNPEVQIFLENIFRELASNYELDGIEYDFIRYPSGNLNSYSGTITNTSGIKDSGYTDSFISLFKERVGFSGDIKSYLNSSKANRDTWLNFKQELLNDTVEMLSTTIKTARPGIKVSAAVMPSTSSARTAYQQDWEYWIDKGWVDVLEPMIYSGNTSYVINSLLEMYDLVDGRAEIVAGIFPEDNDSMLGLNADQIAAIGDAAPVGWAKFSSKKILSSSYLLHSMGLMNRVYTVRPNADINEIYYAYVYDLIDKVENFYQYVDNTKDYTALYNTLNDAFKTAKAATKSEILATLNIIEGELNTIGIVKIKDRLLNTLEYIESLID
jgi:uncharacterized lipoprotein YddW (UPF0748 family)